jgi:hypothetical protein
MKIVFLTNETDFNAKNGGAQRSKMLVNAIKKAIDMGTNLEIISVSFYAYERMPDAQIYDLPISQDIEFAINLRKILEREPQRLTALIQRIRNADYLFVDNCYLSPLIEFICQQKLKSPYVVYLSHNYEKNVKSTTAELLGWPSRNAQFYIQEVSNSENFLWKHSNARVVCAVDDAIQLNGESIRKFSHIPNGGYRRQQPTLSKKELLDFLGCKTYSLFVASGHPPNVAGFLQGIGADSGFIPFDSRLVVVGSCVGPIETTISKTKFWETGRNKLSMIPEASDKLLDNLYAYANSIVLPIFNGSGSSIKSIEALLTNRQLIAAKFALRGIESDAIRESRIDFCASQNEFRRAIHRSLISPLQFSEPGNDVSRLEWNQIQLEASLEIKSIIQLGKR